jgi:uncharacterized protein involved in tolerance to divalent cations
MNVLLVPPPLPEIVALPVMAGRSGHLAWIAAETQGDGEPAA